METSLLDLYDSLKGKPTPLGKPPIQLRMNPMQIGNYRHDCRMHHAMLKEKCGKHILLDIYCKILPLDQDYVDTHQGQMGSDISSMLKQKGMTPTEYLTSAYEKTKAPLLEYVINCIKTIGECYMTEAEEQLQDAIEGDGTDIPPEPASPEEEPVKSQLVDLKNDMEYQQFIDILKKKTVDKIVNDVSELINTKKEENDMEFNTSGGQDDFGSLDNDKGSENSSEESSEGSEDSDNSEGSDDSGELPPVPDFNGTESAVAVGMDYLSRKLWKYEFTEAGRDEALGLAVREASLYQIDKVFRQKSFQEFTSGIYLGKGYVINESAVNAFLEAPKEIDRSQDGTYWKAGDAKDRWWSNPSRILIRETKNQVDQLSRIANALEKIANRGSISPPSKTITNVTEGSLSNVADVITLSQGLSKVGKATSDDVFRKLKKLEPTIDHIKKTVDSIQEKLEKE